MSEKTKTTFVRENGNVCKDTLSKIRRFAKSNRERENHDLVVSEIPDEISVRIAVRRYSDGRSNRERSTIFLDDNFRRILDSSTVAAYLETAANLGIHKDGGSGEISELCARLFLSFAKTLIPLIERKYLNSHKRKPDYTCSHPENFESIATKAFLCWIGEDPSEYLLHVSELFDTGTIKEKTVKRKDENGEISREDTYVYKICELWVNGISYEFQWNQSDENEWYSVRLVDPEIGHEKGKAKNARKIENRFSPAMACGSAFHSFAQYEFHQAHSDVYVLENGETLKYAKKRNDRPDNGFGGLHEMVESGFFRFGRNSRIMEGIAKAILAANSSKHAAIEAEWVFQNGEELPDGWDSNKFRKAVNAIRRSAKAFTEASDYIGATSFFSITQTRGKVLKIDLGEGRKNFAEMTREEILELPEVHDGGIPENLWKFGPHGVTPVSVIGGMLEENEIPDFWVVEPTQEMWELYKSTNHETRNIFRS